MEISCHEVWREISNYLENDISPALRRKMERHFAQCKHCAAVLDGAHNVIMLIGDGRTFTLPAGFSQRLQDKLKEEMEKK